MLPNENCFNKCADAGILIDRNIKTFKLLGHSVAKKRSPNFSKYLVALQSR